MLLSRSVAMLAADTRSTVRRFEMKNVRLHEVAPGRLFLGMLLAGCSAITGWATEAAQVAEPQVTPGQVTWRTHVPAKGMDSDGFRSRYLLARGT